MIDNPAYIKFKAYCEKENFSKEQVEAITKQQAETVADVSLGKVFFDNIKHVYIRQLHIADYEKAREYIKSRLDLDNIKTKFPDIDIRKRRAGDRWVIEIWIDGFPEPAYDPEID